MISVITYGRNDTHGYNLPKRAALSLNCIAEVLSSPDDEIIFVDYNTPNDLPTFIEAIYDTLTDRARALLRVLRVRPRVHARLYGGRTHLAALESISRNVAIRRSNPRNRWILSSNTDMVFVPKGGVPDLTAAVADLEDGHYVVPRFDLPEPLWEGWPRTDPIAVIQACDRLGTALHLNEVTVTYPYMRFDSPGDFQLVPRQTLFDVFGFDERMIHGWHVDSNMCRRLDRFFGQTRSLAERLKGYHCDHTRVATLVHRLDLKLENDLSEFVFDLEDPYARHQADSWGLPGETIEEVDFTNCPAARFATALEASLGRPQDADYEGDANETRNYIAYRSEHVLPYLVGCLTTCAPSTRFLYVGANPRMLELLDAWLSHTPSAGSLRYIAETIGDATGLSGDRGMQREPGATDETFARHLVTAHDALIVDFGLDADTLSSPVDRITDWPRGLRFRLGATARLLEACAEQCHELFTGTPESAPDFVVVNANAWVFAAFVSQFLLTTQTPYNIQVRKGRARLGHERLYRSSRWKATEDTFRALFGYDMLEGGHLMRPGHTIDLTTFGDGHRHMDGHWAGMEPNGTWIDGRRAELLLTIDPAHQADLIVHVAVVQVAARPDAEPFRVGVRCSGTLLAHWVVDSARTYPFLLPRPLFAGLDDNRLTFDIENLPSPVDPPEDAQNPQRLGVLIRSVSFHGTEGTGYQLGTIADFTAGGEGHAYMHSGWTTPDAYGAWTVGPEAELTMYLEETPLEPLWAAFTVSDAAVADQAPPLDVDVRVNGHPVGEWRLGPSRIPHERKVIVPLEAVRQQPLIVSFGIADPRSPAALGWSADARPLGFRLTRLRLAPLKTPPYRWGHTIDFTETGDAEAYLNSNWARPDRHGRWTEGQDATLTLRPDSSAAASRTASFLIVDCMVDPRSCPTLTVQVLVNDRPADEWTLGPRRGPHVRTFELRPDEIQPDRDLVITFRVPEPRSPASLGWSADPRRLGIRLARACFGASRLLALRWRLRRR